MCVCVVSRHITSHHVLSAFLLPSSRLLLCSTFTRSGCRICRRTQHPRWTLWPQTVALETALLHVERWPCHLKISTGAYVAIHSSFLASHKVSAKKNVQETALLEAHLSLSVKPLLHEDLMNHWFGWPPAESAWPRISGMGPTIMQTIQWTLQFVLYIHKLTVSKCSLCSFQMLQFLVTQTWLNVSVL